VGYKYKLQIQISCGVYVPKFESWLAVDTVIAIIIMTTEH